MLALASLNGVGARRTPGTVRNISLSRLGRRRSISARVTKAPGLCACRSKNPTFASRRTPCEPGRTRISARGMGSTSSTNVSSDACPARSGMTRVWVAYPRYRTVTGCAPGESASTRRMPSEFVIPPPPAPLKNTCAPLSGWPVSAARTETTSIVVRRCASGHSTLPIREARIAPLIGSARRRAEAKEGHIPRAVRRWERSPSHHGLAALFRQEAAPDSAETTG